MFKFKIDNLIFSISAFIGLVVSVYQVLTQAREAREVTLAFVPKITCVFFGYNIFRLSERKLDAFGGRIIRSIKLN